MEVIQVKNCLSSSKNALFCDAQSLGYLEMRFFVECLEFLLMAWSRFFYGNE
jgi:hypothetical protein